MNEELRESRKEKFDAMAPRYDSKENMSNANYIYIEVAKHLPDGSQTKSLLDYGCGTGLISLPISDRFASVTLADYAPGMVRVSQGKIDQMGLKNVRAVQADSPEDLGDAAYDCILLSEVLLHVPDYLGLLGSLVAHLKDGGQLIIVDFDDDNDIETDLIHAGFDREQLAQDLVGMGLHDAASEVFYKHPELLMRQPASLFIMTAFK